MREKLISLKEAAKLSGYAPDYVGQLIRQGKIPGKQVYLSVAWMTTEEAVLEYVNKASSKKPNVQSLLVEKFRLFKMGIFKKEQFTSLYKIGLYLTILLCIVLCLILFYIVSVGIEKNLQERAAERVEQTSEKL